MQRFNSVHEKIRAARDEAEVGRALQQFLDALMPSETGTLPSEVQSILVPEPDQAAIAAVTLKTEELMFDGPEEEREFLHSLAKVYEEAAYRVGALRGRYLAP